eukprot:scaffold135348_cov50-Prasinocladus_malaysianus.AAC.1
MVKDYRPGAAAVIPHFLLEDILRFDSSVAGVPLPLPYVHGVPVDVGVAGHLFGPGRARVSPGLAAREITGGFVHRPSGGETSRGSLQVALAQLSVEVRWPPAYQSDPSPSYI